MAFQRCGWLRTDKLLVVEEAGKKFTVKNEAQKKINKVKVDGCLITEGKKCDYLFEVNNEKPEIVHVLYVELKGKNIEHAYEQLLSTMQFCKIRHAKAKKECHIVASRIPKATTETQRLQKILKKDYGANLKIHTIQAIVSL